MQKSPKTGWVKEDWTPKDDTEDTGEIKKILEKAPHPVKDKLPNCTDLKNDFPDVYDQFYEDCTANAVVAIVEYYMRRTRLKLVPERMKVSYSRRFVYKIARKIAKKNGDTGVGLRPALGALKLFGVPPDFIWPYSNNNKPLTKKKLDEEPPAYVYSWAANYKIDRYFIHSPRGKNPIDVLTSVKKYLAGGIPTVFGIALHPSFRQAAKNHGEFPFPGRDETAEYTHNVVAVGYDDSRPIKKYGSTDSSLGALKIRNSWGKGWGDEGYGWVPYDYITDPIAAGAYTADFWSLVKMDWVETGDFQIPDLQPKRMGNGR